MKKFLKYLGKAALLVSVLVLVLLLSAGCLLLFYPLETLHIACGILGVIFLLTGGGLLLSLLRALADRGRGGR